MSKSRDLANIISGGFTADDIPSLDASKITTGSISVDRIPSLDASKIATGTFGASKLDLTDTYDFSSGSITLPAGVGGKVLQVVSASFITQDSTTSATYSDTSITANITPSSASNKILVSVSFRGGCIVGDRAPRYAIFRDSTNITGSSSTEGNNTFIASGGQYRDHVTLTKLDTPSSTSELTYVVKFRCQDGTANTSFCGDSVGTSTITLMEIQG